MSQTTGYQGGVKNRRKRALSRLENQLVSTNTAINTMEQEPSKYNQDTYMGLVSNRNRMQTEISILKTKV